MSKSHKNQLFKRIIDLGKVNEADVDDLVRIWRVGTGDEKAITIADFVQTVNEDLGDGEGLSLTEVIEALEAVVRTKQNIPTGHIIGLQLSINELDNTKFDIATGAYAINTFTDITDINVVVKEITSPIVGITPEFLATFPASYIAIDENENIVQSSSPFTNSDRRNLAILGAVIHTSNTVINVVNEIKSPIVTPTNQLHDFMKAIGSLNLEGNIYGAGTTGMRISKSAGIIWGLGINAQDFGNPHQLTIPLQTDITFRYRLRDSTEYADTQVINPNSWDNGGVLDTVPNNRFTVQRINLFQSGLSRVQYGQVVYDNFDDAKILAPTEVFETEKNIADNAIFRAYLIIKKGVTDLASAIASEDALFIPVDKFGNIVSGAGVLINYDTIITALGYVPENVANKATDFSVVNNTKYPSVKAVDDRINAKTHNSLQSIQGGNASERYHLTAGEYAYLQYLFLNPFLKKHSQLELDDGTNPHNTTKSDVGLSEVDNTSDLNKPVSTAQQAALDLKADKSDLLPIEFDYPITWVYDGVTKEYDLPDGGEENWILSKMVSATWRRDDMLYAFVTYPDSKKLILKSEYDFDSGEIFRFNMKFIYS